MRRLVDRLPAMVAYWDAECRNVVANAAYREWFGIEPEAMRGIHIRHVLGEAVYAKNLPFINAALAGNEQLFERTLVDTSGRERHTQASYVPDIVDGTVAGFFVLVTDVTPRVEAERALRRGVDQYRALARSMPNSFVLLFDAELRCTLADGPALEAFSLFGPALEGRTLWHVLPDRASELEPRFRGALAGETSSWDRVVGGRVFSLTAGPVRGDDGVVFAGMVIGTDVTVDRRREATDRALRRVAAAVADSAAPHQIFDLVVREVREVLQADHAGIARFSDGGTPIVVSMAPDLPDLVENPVLDDDADIATATARVAATGEAQLVRYDEASVGAAGRLRAAGIRASAAAPIFVNGALWGSIGISLPDSSDRISSDELLTRLVEFADMVALSMSSAAAWQALNDLATIDSLTGLPNRRTFELAAAAAVATARRQSAPLAVAVLDLDRFKDINDTFGHAAGDRVLIEAARRMSACTRAGELLARVGGEEFALLLPGADMAAAVRATERLRSSVGATAIDTYVVTASAGVAAATPELDLDAEALLGRADTALYAAKRTGRDRTSAYGE